MAANIKETVHTALPGDKVSPLKDAAPVEAEAPPAPAPKKAPPPKKEKTEDSDA